MIRQDVKINDIAMTVFLPELGALRCPVVVMVGGPGATYSRGYFDMEGDYSQARYHVAQGFIFIAYDHLTVGDSLVAGSAARKIEAISAANVADFNLESILGADPTAPSFEAIAAANHAGVRAAIDKLISGTLVAGYPPVNPSRVIGIGQSMGGAFTEVMQALHQTYDAIAILGFVLSVPIWVGRDGAPTEDHLAAARYTLHWDDEPNALIEADMAGWPVRTSGAPWTSSTVPPAIARLYEPGFVESFADRIDVPILFAVGERDVVADPHADAAKLTKSRDVTLLIVPRMAHMHNFAPTRRILWDRIARWTESI